VVVIVQPTQGHRHDARLQQYLDEQDETAVDDDGRSVRSDVELTEGAEQVGVCVCVFGSQENEGVVSWLVCVCVCVCERTCVYVCVGVGSRGRWNCVCWCRQGGPLQDLLDECMCVCAEG